MNQHFYTFECALSTKIHHYCIDAIQLPCGHYLCKECFTKIKPRNTNLGCKFCHRVFPSRVISNKLTNIAINAECNFAEFYQNLLTQSKSIFKTKEDHEDCLDNRIDFICDSIDTRVESLKAELDILADSYKKEIKDLRDQLKKQLDDKFDASSEWIADLEKAVNDEAKHTTGKLDHFQANIRDAYVFFENFNEQSQFRVSEASLDKHIICTRFEGCDSLDLALGNNSTNMDILNYETINRLQGVHHKNENEYFIVYTNEIVKYDLWTNRTETIFNTANYEFIVDAKVIKSDETIYLAYKRKIEMRNFGMELVKCFDYADNLFMEPTICAFDIYKNCIYAYVKEAKTFKKISLDLNFIEDIVLDGRVEEIQKVTGFRIASNGIACMCTVNEDSVVFFNVEKRFSILYNYSYGGAGVTLYNDVFYVTHYLDYSQLYVVGCYRNTGELKCELNSRKSLGKKRKWFYLFDNRILHAIGDDYNNLSDDDDDDDDDDIDDDDMEEYYNFFN